jgi:C_GCAxxG_C_C family probable redox protein
MASAVGAGFARLGTVCGAVCGGSMALGFYFGPAKAEEKEARERTYGKVRDMIRAFEKEFGSIQCRELVGFNLLDPEELKKYRKSPVRNRCGQMVSLIVENVRQAVKERTVANPSFRPSS